MQSQKKIFEDMAKVLNGAAGSFAGMAREVQEGAKERAREFMGGVDFVSREEFDVLAERVAALEAALSARAATDAPLKTGKSRK